HWTKGIVKVEHARVRVDAEKDGHVDIVGQGGGKANNADHLLAGLDLSQRAGNNALQYRASVVIQQVDLVDDQQLDLANKVDVARALSRQNIPLFGRRHQQLRLAHFAARQLHVAGALSRTYPKTSQPPRKLASDLCSQCLHRGNVDDLKVL